jgi:CheY-like chemotaxis protein
MSASVGLLLSDDLIDSSRITATARSLGLTVKAAKSVEALELLAAQSSPACVLVDLSYPGLALPDLMTRLGATCGRPLRVVAYGSHVDVASLKAARAAGCDPVLPRSAFVEQLPNELTKWLSS